MFDESGDPFNHLMHFRQVMTLQCKNDPLLCKVFPSSLRRPALAWFNQLPPGSVASFHKLSIIHDQVIVLCKIEAECSRLVHDQNGERLISKGLYETLRRNNPSTKGCQYGLHNAGGETDNETRFIVL